LDSYINVSANNINLYGDTSVSLHTNNNGTEIIVLQEELVFIGRKQFPGY
jgi:hypothetical protein